MSKFKKYLTAKLITYLTKGVTRADFLDLDAMSSLLYKEYCRAAKAVHNNEAFQAEVDRLLYKQEQYLLKKAQHADDLIFGRAAIYVLSELRKRFSEVADELKEEKETEHPNY